MIVVEATTRYGVCANANDIEHILKYYSGNNPKRNCVVQIMAHGTIYNLVASSYLVPRLMQLETMTLAEEIRPTTKDMINAQMRMRPMPKATQKLSKLVYRVITDVDRYTKYKVLTIQAVVGRKG